MSHRYLKLTEVFKTSCYRLRKLDYNSKIQMHFSFTPH